MVPNNDHLENQKVCEECGYHERASSEEYFQILFNEGQYLELNPDMTSGDPLKFIDTKNILIDLKRRKRKPN